MTLVVFGVAVGAMLVVIVLLAILLKFSLVHVRASEALVVYAPGREPRVSFRGMLVLPFHTHEIVDLAAKELVFERRGKAAVRCRDGARADLTLAVRLGVNPTSEDVLRAARALGSGRTGDLEAVRARFAAKLDASLDDVVTKVDLAELSSRRMEVEDRILDVVGHDLDGYVVHEAHLRDAAPTPPEPSDAAAARGGESAGAGNPDGGYRDAIASAEARVDALRADLDEAEKHLAALRTKGDEARSP